MILYLAPSKVEMDKTNFVQTGMFAPKHDRDTCHSRDDEVHTINICSLLCYRKLECAKALQKDRVAARLAPC